ncbi:hypothetical protein [Nocardia wallacei]|uniref:hypothetical protein n=1 Tax=Nocardia wallacei TaxID=480035 RepID=UPI0024566391|nr:hypothetical protein [Nocardia wallacei]
MIGETLSEWALPAGGVLGLIYVLAVAAVPIARSVIILISGLYANVHPDEKRRQDSKSVYEIADRDRPRFWQLGRAQENPPPTEDPPGDDETAR